MKKIRFHLALLLSCAAVFLYTSLIPLNTIQSSSETKVISKDNKNDKSDKSDRSCYDQSDHKISFI